MGASRVSNKDIAAKLDTLIDLMTANAMAATAAPTAAPVSTETEIEVDEAYLAHQSEKAQAHATSKGEAVVVYGRKNKAGQTKIAYALRSRFDEQVSKQPSCLGPIAEFQPQS